MCVSEGHVVVRGLLDFIVFGPGRLVRAVGRGFAAVADFVSLFISVLRGTILPSIFSVFWGRVVPNLTRAVVALLVFVEVDTVLGRFIAAILYSRTYNRKAAPTVYRIQSYGFHSSSRIVVAHKAISRSAAMAAGMLYPAGVSDWLVFITISPICVVVFGVLLP